MTRLTHFDDIGRPRMVDVSAKPVTLREATACGRVRMEQATLDHLLGGTAKGDVIGIAPDPDLPGLTVIATARTRGPTGVEMEAMTAVSVACLTIYDMLKAIDRGMTIEAVELVAKSGGKSGTWRRDP